MPALSFERTWLDDLLSGCKQYTTRPITTRFYRGDIVHMYIEQRGKIIGKPIRELTTIGISAMTDRINNINHNYPGLVSTDYFAHFIGKVKLVDVFEFTPVDVSTQFLELWAHRDGFGDFAAADEWFTKYYGGQWMYLTWTVIGWDGWSEVYFESLNKEVNR